MTQEYSQELAIHGGTPAKQNPDPPMYPGGMAIADEEEAGVLEVLRAKRLSSLLRSGRGRNRRPASWNWHLPRRKVPVTRWR